MSSPATITGWWRPRADPTVTAYRSLDALQNRDLRFPFWSVIAFTLILILAPQDQFHALKPLHLALITGTFSSVTYLWSRVAGNAGQVRHSPALVVAVLIFIWALASVPFSLWPGGSVAKIFGIFIRALIIFWLLSRVINSVPRLRTIAWILVLASIPLSFNAITTFLHGGAGNAELSHGLERIAGYDGGLTSNPNDLALMINITVPFAIGLIMAARRLSARILLIFVVFLDVFAVLATYSRGGFLTLITIVGAYLVCLRGRRRRALLLILLTFGLFAFPVIPSGYYSRISTITDIQADPTDSAQQRWSDMKYATDLIVAHPVIGAGAGMDYLALNAVRGDTWKHVHNIYLEYGVDLGIPGLALFLILYYKVLMSARAARKISQDHPGSETLYRLSESIWIVLVAIGVSAFFQPIAYEFYFYYIAGLSVAVGNIAAMAATNPEARRRGDS